MMKTFLQTEPMKSIHWQERGCQFTYNLIATNWQLYYSTKRNKCICNAWQWAEIILYSSCHDSNMTEHAIHKHCGQYPP